MRKKGIKLADTIEIEFYVQQLQEEAGDKLTSAAIKLFIQKAKKELHAQGTPHPIDGRPGLYTFARKFLVQLNKGILIGEMKNQKWVPQEKTRSKNTKNPSIL